MDLLKQALHERFSFPEGDIRLLTDAAATRQGIVDAFRDHLITKAIPGALVYFHYSGHGQQIADDNGDELDGLDESLVTADYKSQSAQDGAATNLRDDTIGELLRQLRARMVDPADGQFKGNITVTFDCCFSGTATRGEPPSGRLTHRGRGWNEAIDGPRPPAPARGKPEDSTGILDAGEALTQGYVAITATRSDQTAKEEKMGENQLPMGAFTFYLYRALSQATPRTTYRDVFEQVNAELIGHFPDQSPTIEGEADKPLFSGVAVPPDPYVVVQDNDAPSGTVTLPVGRLQGATVGSRFAIYRAGSDVKRPENRIAEAQITEARTTTSLTQLQGEQTKWPKPAELKAARAVETEHNYGDLVLKVFLDGITGPVVEAIRQRKVLTTAEVTKDNYDVRVGMNREGDKLILEHKDGRIIRELDPQTPEAAKAKIVGEALFGAWMWLFVSRLRNDDPQSLIQVEFRLVPVEVELNPVTKKVRKIIRERTDVKPEGNRLVLHEGDCVVPEVRNSSKLSPAHITILDLASNGTIAPIYPKPRTEDDTKFKTGEGWRSLGINYVFRATLPPGATSDIDVFKAIGTREAADFSALLYQPADRRGSDKLKEDVRGMRGGRHHALARLLGLAKLGEDPDPPAGQLPLRVRTRAVEVVTAEVTDWSTAEFVLEVRKRTP